MVICIIRLTTINIIIPQRFCKYNNPIPPTVTRFYSLFFLVYFASSMQMERRKHEFGVYLTLGMRRSKLFLLLLLEDLRNSVLALGIGLPISILISELISLITAKIVGLGIIEHQFSLSTQLYSIQSSAS